MRGTYAYDGQGLQRCKKMANNAPPRSPPHCHILNHGKGFSSDNERGRRKREPFLLAIIVMFTQVSRSGRGRAVARTRLPVKRSSSTHVTNRLNTPEPFTSKNDANGKD